MLVEEQIKKGEDAGLAFTGEFDQEDRPIFVGTEKNWRKYDEIGKLEGDEYVETN